MAQVKIVTDSTADLPPELARELDITVIPLTVHFGKEVLRDGIDIDSQRFFKRLRTMKSIPTTAPPPARAFEEAYGPIEKVRKRQRAIEKLCEFTLEFSKVRKMTILHSENASDVKELTDRIREHLPAVPIEVAPYGPVLASHVGPDALGIVIFEEIL